MPWQNTGTSLSVGQVFLAGVVKAMLLELMMALLATWGYWPAGGGTVSIPLQSKAAWYQLDTQMASKQAGP